MKNLQEALVGVHLLLWIVTYPVDKVIRSLNNWGQALNVVQCFTFLIVSHGLGSLDLSHSEAHSILVVMITFSIVFVWAYSFDLYYVALLTLASNT